MARTSLEERMSSLEAEVADLKARLQEADHEMREPWWQQISGVFKDDELFDEAARLGREWRESEREDCGDQEDDGRTGDLRVST
jgi:hypothetical protein